MASGKTVLPSWSSGPPASTSAAVAAPGPTKLPSWSGGGDGTKLPSWSGGNSTPMPVDAPKKKAGSGFFSNLAHDAESTLSNIGPGVVEVGKSVAHDFSNPASLKAIAEVAANPGSAPNALHHTETGRNVVEPILHNYAQTYGPLLHGDVGKFAHNVEQHPLGPMLDLLTLATGGAGAVGKLGGALGKAGVIADDSRLAQLGKAGKLTAPDFAKRAGQGGEDVTIKASSANPAIRARQTLVNNALNRLPVNTPVVGSAARVVKALAKDPERAAARLTIAENPFGQAFSKLTGDEKAAWHMAMRQVHPADYAAHLEAQPAGSVSAATLNILKSPKVQRLYERPSRNLAAALSKGRALSDTLTQLKVQAGHISEQAAAESPYRLLRIVNGAVHRPVMADGSPALLAQTATDHVGLVDQPGRSIPALAKELAAKGRPQPAYVPDSAETGTAGAGTFSRKPTGLAEPGKSGSSRQNLGVLANMGLLAMNQNPLSRDFLRFRNQTEGSLLHDELVKHAAALPHGTPLPANYDYLKLNRGEPSAPYTEKVAAQFEHALNPGTVDKMLTKDEASGDIATHPQTGERLVVPTQVRKILENRSLNYNGVLHHLLYNQPTSVWKHIILGLRPAFFGNITVGNSILGALQMAPGRHGLLGWINQVAPGAEKLLGPKLTRSTLADVMPEQALGTFGRQMGFGDASPMGKLAAKTGRAGRAAHTAYQGVMPATIAYENVLRRAMAEGWAKASPEVRAAMRQNGGDVNGALRSVAKTHPQTINDISKRIDDALGNYRTYNSAEQKIKQLIPFYGWDRHIVRSTGRLVSERPGRLNALTRTGQLGQQHNDQTLGELPTFLQGAVQLPGLPKFMGPTDGRTPLLTTHSLNPFSTVADLAQIPEALTGRAGGSSETLASGLNPILQAIIEQMTGHSLLTGATLRGNAFANAATNIVPQISLIAQAAGRGPKSKPTSLYRKDWQTSLAAFLGAPVKKTNLLAAHKMAQLEGKPHR